MNDYMDSRELMEMKEQLSILTQKLEKETIVNKRLMRRAMKNKISKMQRHALIKGIVIALAIPYLISCLHVIGTSSWFNAVSICSLITALFCDYRIHRNLHSNEAMYGNLMEVRKKVLSIKQAYKNWLKFSIPFIIVWLIWFLYELIQLTHIPKDVILTGFLLGGIIGGITGTLQYKKIQRTTDEILQQIEEMEENNPSKT